MSLRAICRSSIFAASLCASNSLASEVPDGLALNVPRTAPSTATFDDASAAELLARVRAVNENLYSSLQSFVCREQIERFIGPLNGNTAQHIDTVTTKVSFENGIEHYTDILQNKQRRARISSVNGAWSEGEFGTLLQQTRILLATQTVQFKTYTDVDDTPAAIYQVDISAESSPWDLDVESRHYRIPFRTDVWVSRATGEILKIERASMAVPLPTGITEIRWCVTLQPVQIDQKTWLLPTSGSYAVLYRSTGHREWNELTFSDYHRYGSEVALRFQ